MTPSVRLLPAGVALVTGALFSASDQTTFKSGIRTVAIYATVQDKEGRLVPDLTKDDFRILDNGRLAEIRTFSSETVPITVALLLDMSNSMAAEALRVRDAAGAFVDALEPRDRARIGSFNDEVSLSPHLTGDKSILKRVLAEELWPGGGTPLWTAVSVGLTSLAAEPGRRVALALSDGGDACPFGFIGVTFQNAAEMRARNAPLCRSAADVKGQALLGEFMIYAVGMEGPGLDGALTDLAAETGGGYFKLRRNADLAATFTRVVDELHHQYVIGFEPPVLDGQTHRLEVKLTRPGLTARSRKSYLAVAK